MKLNPKLTKPADLVTAVGILLGAYEAARTFIAHQPNPAVWGLAAALFVGGIIWHFRSPRRHRPRVPDRESLLKL